MHVSYIKRGERDDDPYRQNPIIFRTPFTAQKGRGALDFDPVGDDAHLRFMSRSYWDYDVIKPKKTAGEGPLTAQFARFWKLAEADVLVEAPPKGIST